MLAQVVPSLADTVVGEERVPGLNPDLASKLGEDWRVGNGHPRWKAFHDSGLLIAQRARQAFLELQKLVGKEGEVTPDGDESILGGDVDAWGVEPDKEGSYRGTQKLFSQCVNRHNLRKLNELMPAP